MDDSSAKSGHVEAVKVVVRCRPMSEKETLNGHVCVVKISQQMGTVEISNPKFLNKNEENKLFTFDAVYDWNSQQEDLYEESVRPLVSSVLDGFNSTIFAYGQTGAGKTFTMEGSKSDPKQKGIIPKAFEQIFSHISRSSSVCYLVHASYLEIYQEEIRDLLDNRAKYLELRENPDHGVYVKGLTSHVCKNVTEIENLMAVGNQNRSIGSTDMNEHSSRSHAIFIVTIEMEATDHHENAKVYRVGKLNLVDLAGSERQNKTRAKGNRLKEASKINLSLSALGNVISALVHQKDSHIPYRDSKLTRLLQDSLGGNSKTLMIANIGPASYNYDETLTTLRYANRAKNIKNKPRINEDPKDALLREYQKEVAMLKELIAQRSKEKNQLLESEKKRPSRRMSPQLNNTKNELTETSTNDKTNLKDNQDILKKCELLGKKDIFSLKENMTVEQLKQQLNSIEEKLLFGGKNIIDHTNEQQRALELKQQEIAEQKRREIEIMQRLELHEDSALEFRETYSSLQQEVEAKTKKLKKIYSKYMAIKMEINDLNEEFNFDRRELQVIQNDLLKEYKVRQLIVDNFIPVDFKNNMLQRAYFNEDLDKWCVNDSEPVQLCKRPSVSEGKRRPLSDYSRISMKMGHNHRFCGENIVNWELNVCRRTTYDYQGPVVAPNIKGFLSEVLKGEGDMDVDAAALKISQKPKSSYRNRSAVRSLKTNTARKKKLEISSNSTDLAS